MLRLTVRSRVMTVLLASSVLFSPYSQAGFLDGVKNLGSAVADSGKTIFNKSKQFVGLTDVVDDLKKPFIDMLGEQTEYAAANRDDGGVMTEAEPSPEKDIIMSRRAGQALINDGQMTEYLNNILYSVLVAWNGEPVNARVFIVSDEGYRGVARENGGIFIPIDTILNMESEDELAALLSHEVAHIILGHHASDKTDEITDKALNYAQMGLVLKAGVSGTDVASDFNKLRVANFLINDAFFPKWNRGQENEADLLGTDLLLRSGYSFEGMMILQKKLSDYEAQNNELLFESYASLDGSGLQSNAGFDINGLVGDSVSKLQQTLSKRHESSDKRRKRLFEYAKKFYQDRARPELKVEALQTALSSDKLFTERALAFREAKKAHELLYSAQLDTEAALQSAMAGVKGNNSSDSYARKALFEVRKNQGDRESAMKNLDIAIESGTATYNIYYNKYAILWQKRDYAQAGQVLSTMEDIFGAEYNHMPLKIDLIVRAGKKAELAVAECLTKGDIDLVAKCQEAAEGRFRPVEI